VPWDWRREPPVRPDSVVEPVLWERWEPGLAGVAGAALPHWSQKPSTKLPPQLQAVDAVAVTVAAATGAGVGTEREAAGLMIAPAAAPLGAGSGAEPHWSQKPSAI
jgi:hypothetical protein